MAVEPYDPEHPYDPHACAEDNVGHASRAPETPDDTEPADQ